MAEAHVLVEDPAGNKRVLVFEWELTPERNYELRNPRLMDPDEFRKDFEKRRQLAREIDVIKPPMEAAISGKEAS